MADEKEKKTTTAKAPAKTVQRVRKSAKKAEQAETKVELKDGAKGRNGSEETGSSEGGTQNVTGSIRNG